MTERAARLVEHIFRVAKPGEELYSVMTRGTETEDTPIWLLNDSGGVNVEQDIVYPAMARVAGPSRTTTIEQAKRDVLAALLAEDTGGSLVPYLEKRWHLSG